jgi:hypothetical protein
MSLCWTFLSLPKEIRLMILNICIGTHTFHIMQNGSSMCNQPHTNVCKGPTGCHLHPCSETLVCTSCNKSRLPGVSATCRILHSEVSQVLYSRTLLSFMSSAVFFNFIESRLTHRHMVNFSLSKPRRIQLSLGQGKYSSANNQAQNCKALRLLAEEACELRELHVYFQYSPRAAASKWPVTDAIMESLCRFRGLKVFTFTVDAAPAASARCSCGHDLLYTLWTKVDCMQTAFRDYTYRDRTPSKNHNPGGGIRGSVIRSNRFLHSFKTQVLLMTER